MMPRKTGSPSSSSAPRTCFNEAGAMMPRKTAKTAGVPSAIVELQ